MTLTVRPVHDRKGITAFIRLPYAIYRDDPHWVAPLETERREFLSPRKNPFFETGSAQLFLASRDGHVVGRIAAVADPRFNDRHGPGHGFFGLFECTNDLEAAAALFKAVDRWLSERGLTTVLGPMSFTTNDECGLLIDGFDRPPAVLIPYNPRYYVTLLEGCGFTKAKDLWSWVLVTPEDGAPPSSIARIAERVRAREDIRVRRIDMRRFEQEIVAVRDIYESAWAENWGAVPMTQREFDHMAKQLKPFIRAEGFLIAEVNGVPAAFALVVPDLNQVLRKLHGRLTPIGLLRLFWGVRRIKRARLMALGIKKEYRIRGIDAVMFDSLQRVAHQLGYNENEISWTLEDNNGVNSAIKAMGGVRIRTHRIYQRNIA